MLNCVFDVLDNTAFVFPSDSSQIPFADVEQGFYYLFSFVVVFFRGGGVGAGGDWIFLDYSESISVASGCSGQLFCSGGLK